MLDIIIIANNNCIKINRSIEAIEINSISSPIKLRDNGNATLANRINSNNILIEYVNQHNESMYLLLDLVIINPM